MLLLQRADVCPFTDKQIELVETFADQAVIAIENVRLFEAEQQRTREVSESLEQQTATSRGAQGHISSSPGELQPVFESMLENGRSHLRREVWKFFRLGRTRKCHIGASNAEDDFVEFASEYPFVPTLIIMQWTRSARTTHGSRRRGFDRSRIRDAGDSYSLSQQ